MQDKNDLDDTLTLYHERQTIQQEILEEDHLDIALPYNIGSVLEAKGCHNDVLEMYQRCLTIREKVFGKHLDSNYLQ